MNLWAKTHATFYEKMTSRNCLYCLYCHHQIVATIIVSILKLSHDNCRDNLMSRDNSISIYVVKDLDRAIVDVRSSTSGSSSI